MSDAGREQFDSGTSRTVDDYVHIYELHPHWEQRTCRTCGEERWFHYEVSNRWPHHDCGDMEGFSKPGAIPDEEVTA